MSIERVVVPGLDDAEQATLDVLWAQLVRKRPRNRLRAAFYDGKNAWRDAGISTPPSMRRIAPVLGWSAKAVDILNRRCNLDGVTVAGVDDDLGLDEIWRENALDLESSQAGVSSLIHATSFLITTVGDESAGEPRALVTAKDALTGTGEWDRRSRRLSSFLSLIETSDEGRPIEFVLYLPNLTIVARKSFPGWEIERQAHKYGVPVEPLVYQPRLGRPFGSSRISRPIMSIQESALRTILRSEVTAEFYSAPQRVLLGADESAFRNADGTVKSTWQAILGRIWAIGDDEGAANPRADVKEFTQASQQPHVDQLRAWAELFAGEAGIPLASLGISADANPTSSEAYEAGRDDLIREAEGVTDAWTPAWRRTMLRAAQIKNGWDEIPADVAKGITIKWRNPAYGSRAAAVDAAVKTIDKFPWLAQSELGLELFGFDQPFLERAKVELQRQRSSGVLEALRQRAEGAAGGPVVGGA